MRISSKSDYDAAAARAAALDDAPEGTPAAAERATLREALRRWDQDQAGGDGDQGAALTKDDLPFTGLPGNLGKLKAD